MNAIKAKDPTTCCSRSVMLYADGELDPSHTVELEAHLKVCDECHAQADLIRSMRASLRRSCARPAPRVLEERMRSVLANACNDANEMTGPRVAVARPSVAMYGEVRLPVANDARGRRWALVGAAAVAACFVVVIVMRSDSQRVSRGVTVPLSQALAANVTAANDDGTSLDALLDELVSQHANPLPPEEKNPDRLTRLEPYVGVPVRRPALTLLHNVSAVSASGVGNGAKFDDGGNDASFDGARIHRVRESKNAAALLYQFKGHRLTIYVFDPHKIPLARNHLRSRYIQQSPVYVGNVRGFSVAAAERSGVGYALASDMDEDRSVQMVASF